MSTIKLTADSGSGTVSIKAPSSTGSNGHREFTLPDTYSGNGSLVTANSSGQILINTATSREIGGGNAELQIENTNTESVSITRTSADGGSAYLHFGKTRNGSVVQDGDGLGSIAFNGDDGTDLNHAAAEIRAFVNGTPGSNDMPGRLAFYTTSDGASTTTERMRIHGTGVCIGRTAPGVDSSNFGIDLMTNGGLNNSRNVAGDSGSGVIAGNQGMAIIYGDGDIKNTNNSYGQISDQTLKQDIVDAASQWDDIKQVRVRKFRFKDNPTAPLQIGVIAQELETISPGLVKEVYENGEDGNKVKSVKYSVLYMKAIKALQEAMAKIETLETKVAALEAK